MIYDNNFGNAGIKAIATTQGLTITFNRRALLALKSGKYGSIDLVSGGTKLHLKLMRDSTFKQMQHDNEIHVATMKEQQKDIEDLASELTE